MGSEQPCIKCSLNDMCKCTCLNCVNLYINKCSNKWSMTVNELITYEYYKGSFKGSIMRFIIKRMNLGKFAPTDYKCYKRYKNLDLKQCNDYREIGWVDEIKYKKILESKQKKEEILYSTKNKTCGQYGSKQTT